VRRKGKSVTGRQAIVANKVTTYHHRVGMNQLTESNPDTEKDKVTPIRAPA
jgi:hypothetical protein